MQNIHIIGSGAMACLWGSYFPADSSIIFINRKQTSGPFHYTVSPSGRMVHGETQSIADIETIDRLIVATKAFDALNAVRSVSSKLSSQCEILVLQNGMGSQQAIAQEFSHLAIYACSSTEGAYKPHLTELVHAGHGENTVGNLTPHANQRKLRQWLPNDCYKWVEDIEPVLWKKLLVNCAINPLTAIYQCQNGKLLENAEALSLMEQICQELDELVRKRNMPLSNSFELAKSVCQSTANNYSSMFQDVHHGRSTEINYINGYVVQQCQQLGVACPANQSVLEKMHIGAPH